MSGGLFVVLGVSLLALGAFIRWIAPGPDQMQDRPSEEYQAAGQRMAPWLLCIGLVLTVSGLLILAIA